MAFGVPKKLASWLALQERHELVEYFLNVVKPSERGILLEIGGPTGSAKEIVSVFKTVLVINMSSNWAKVNLQECNYPAESQIIMADGCFIPLMDQSVDFIFCNATLEHIPRESWGTLSQEIERVTLHGFFISVPNYWFPFEPHYLMPFFQFIPQRIKRKLIMDYGLTIGYINKNNYEQTIHLPKKRELNSIFPKAKIQGVGWGQPLMPAHWICYEKKG